jgi:prepilin-type N-terminal cleavage/methylation domain-containing protein
MKHDSSIIRGFSLLELLAVVVTMAVLLALGGTMFFSATADARSKECRANLQTIANLEEQYRIKDSAHAYTTTLSNLVSTGTTLPICPNAGTYSITISTGTSTAQNGQTVPSGGLIINCSTSGHGKFAPGIDTY